MKFKDKIMDKFNQIEGNKYSQEKALAEAEEIKNKAKKEALTRMDIVKKEEQEMLMDSITDKEISVGDYDKADKAIGGAKEKEGLCENSVEKKLKILNAQISFRQLEVPWVHVFDKERMCPVHQTMEYPGSCPFLAVVVAPKDADVVRTDVGSPSIEPAELDGWLCIGGKASGGHAHNSYIYARENTQDGKEILKWAFKTFPSSAVYEIKETEDGFIIYTTNPGPWIGRGGRWAKAYRKIGVNVQIREATLVDLNKISNEEGEKIRKKALWVRKIETKERGSTGALIPGKNNELARLNDYEVVKVRLSENA